MIDLTGRERVGTRDICCKRAIFFVMVCCSVKHLKGSLNVTQGFTVKKQVTSHLCLPFFSGWSTSRLTIPICLASLIIVCIVGQNVETGWPTLLHFLDVALLTKLMLSIWTCDSLLIKGSFIPSLI